ncbi:MAG TPA: ATP-dependent metallopeptidase FtsH/Yme1/Tma family protein, partial [Mycobacteriales bacterium]|nr:ATP-dependent metallopeptidase FtsH/Yme1/Tma family protein [Mycobacteriales bacterium]
MERTRFFRRPLFWIILVILAALLIGPLFTGGDDYKKVDTSVALAQIDRNNFNWVKVEDKEQLLTLRLKKAVNGHKRIQASYPSGASRPIFDLLRTKQSQNNKVKFDTKVSKDNVFVTLLISVLPIAILVLLLLFFMSQMQGGGNRVMNFGKSKAKLVSKDTPKTTFADVAGSDEAIEELQEIKDFLQHPAKYQAIGA